MRGEYGILKAANRPQIDPRSGRGWRPHVVTTESTGLPQERGHHNVIVFGRAICDDAEVATSMLSLKQTQLFGKIPPNVGRGRIQIDQDQKWG